MVGWKTKIPGGVSLSERWAEGRTHGAGFAIGGGGDVDVGFCD